MSNFGEVAIRDVDDTKTVGITDPDGDGVGGLDIYTQDQFTNIADLYLLNDRTLFSLASDTVLDATTITAAGGHGVSTGEVIFLSEGEAFMQAVVLNVVTNTITIDTPIDDIYTVAGVVCQRGLNELNVVGTLGAPIIFGIGPLGDKQWDVTRIMMQITDGTAMDSAKFGGISALTNGIVIRSKNSVKRHNIFNAKTNGDLALRMFDLIYDDKAPSGSFGLRNRRTFAGQSKNGVTVRLGESGVDEIQIVVQDDLTGLASFKAVIQGHVVE